MPSETKKEVTEYMTTVLVLLLISVWIIAAVRSIIKKKRLTSCGSCGKCPGCKQADCGGKDNYQNNRS